MSDEYFKAEDLREIEYCLGKIEKYLASISDSLETIAENTLKD